LRRRSPPVGVDLVIDEFTSVIPGFPVAEAAVAGVEDEEDEEEAVWLMVILFWRRRRKKKGGRKEIG